MLSRYGIHLAFLDICHDISPRKLFQRKLSMKLISTRTTKANGMLSVWSMILSWESASVSRYLGSIITPFFYLALLNGREVYSRVHPLLNLRRWLLWISRPCPSFLGQARASILRRIVMFIIQLTNHNTRIIGLQDDMYYIYVKSDVFWESFCILTSECSSIKFGFLFSETLNSTEICLRNSLRREF